MQHSLYWNIIRQNSLHRWIRVVERHTSLLHKQHEFILGAALRCVQCGQGNLQDAEADCEKQIVVECNRRGTRLAKEEQYFCFTRQILIGPGE